MQHTSESKWDHEINIRQFEPYRAIFREASSQVIRDIMAQHVGQSSRILEIGSGLGEFTSLVPEYKYKILQSEQSERVAKQNKTLNPDLPIVVASVYSLPFNTQQFDIVMGYSVFDNFLNLEKAFGEVSRVLKSGGTFLHFLDLQASPEVLFEQYKGKEVILFPSLTSDVPSSAVSRCGLQLVNKIDLDQLKRYFSDSHVLWGPWFESYVRDPMTLYRMGIINPRYQSVLKKASEIVKQSGLAKEINPNDEFHSSLERNLLANGFSIIQLGVLEAMALQSRTGILKQYSAVNVFVNNVGIGTSTYDPKISSELGDRVKTISRLHVAAAQKYC